MSFDEVKAAITAKSKVKYHGRLYIITAVTLLPKQNGDYDDFWEYSLELTTPDLRGMIAARMEFVKLA